jgi:uncharacterized protein (DUF2267 family)
MDYETFEKTVAIRAGVPPERARALIRATLDTLGERLTRGEAYDLAAQLPGELKEWLNTAEPEAERFGLDEFVSRVSRRAGATPEDARAGARAVFTTLRDAVTSGEFQDVMSQLPQEFSQLLES